MPPEIISYITRYVPEDYECDARSIVPLTHVCQYWRDSIISTPDNWTSISNEWEGLAVLSLERAKAAPLAMHLDMYKLDPTKHPRLHKLLLSHIQYTRSLYATGISTANLAQNLPDFPKSMPNLRSLTLMNGIGGQVDWPQLDPFDFSAHTLRDLSLRNVPLHPPFLSIRTLMELTIVDYHSNLHLDVLLDFLEENHSLESAKLSIGFVEPSLCRSRRQTPIRSRLQHLSISCMDAADGLALISGIALRRGAALEIFYYGGNTKLADLLSGLSTMHLPNLSAPIFMKYRPPSKLPTTIRLLGPGGSFGLSGYFYLQNDFRESFPFTLDTIREIRLEYHAPSIPTEILLSSFPSLEVFVISNGACISLVLSALFPNPTSSPLLKTLAFLNCVMTEDFMDELAQFASRREKTTSASVHRVVITGSDGGLPSVASIERLRKCVPVVEVTEGHKLPMDLL